MITLVVGGARSGKSSFAESIYKGKKEVVYIATSRAEDEEMKQRATRHRETRPGCWRTFEGTYDLEDAVGKEKCYLLDCLTVLTSNVMFDRTMDMERIGDETQKCIEEDTVTVISKLVGKAREQGLDLVMVTNEVGCSIVPENHVARVYRDIIGRVNQRVAAMADEAYAVFCGIPLRLK